MYIVEHIVEHMTPKTETIHESYLDNIPVNMEIIELPIFGKNKKVKRNDCHLYLLNRNRTSHLTVTPFKDDRIPLEFEEKLFYTIIKIGQRQQYQTNSSVFPDKIYTTLYDICNILGYKSSGHIYDLIMNGLIRLKETSYRFKNCFYNGNKNIIENELRMSILDSLMIVKLKDVDITDPRLQMFSHTSKLTEFIEISISSAFSSNMLSKQGHLLYSADKLLQIDDGIARTIFMYCDKNRWNSHDDLKFTVKAEQLAHIIPLSWTTASNINGTVNRIKKAFMYLKTNGYITDYVSYCSDRTRYTWFEIFFEESRKYGVITGRENLRIEKTEIIDISADNNMLQQQSIGYQTLDKQHADMNDNFSTNIQRKMAEINQLTQSQIKQLYAIYQSSDGEYKLEAIISIIQTKLADKKRQINNFDGWFYMMINDTYYQDKANKLKLDAIEKIQDEKLKKEQLAQEKIHKEQQQLEALKKQVDQQKMFSQWQNEFYKLDYQIQEQCTQQATNMLPHAQKHAATIEIDNLAIYCYAANKSRDNIIHFYGYIKFAFV